MQDDHVLDTTENSLLVNPLLDGAQDSLEPQNSTDAMNMGLDEHPFFQAMLQRVDEVIYFCFRMFTSLEHE